MASSIVQVRSVGPAGGALSVGAADVVVGAADGVVGVTALTAGRAVATGRANAPAQDDVIKETVNSRAGNGKERDWRKVSIGMATPKE